MDQRPTTENQQLAGQIEALLFALGRPLSRAELQKHLDADVGQINESIERLRRRDGGITVVDDGKMLELRTGSDAAVLIERVRREENSREIGRAGLEALTAVLYRGPLTRSEIDFIRGVNSSQTLRTLTMRGLVRRVQNPKDERSYLYEPTTDLLGTLGVASAKDLPDWENVREKLQKLEDAYRSRAEEQQ
ncbi:MAG: Segregation and condensation protein B [Candidatus Adlerbacteria bacterium GW2011_GWA1_54_10]|uniref:Segregation and condensation protein B n=2 Tax=Candidatus Adleribacteriota TaxID=1752736 RepID=A0A0G2A4R7_9BACT|nr:MAG: Segregation and condensation protein B [Candidatus Adlerbacteria bacterium GW2011_GWA1_54_10]KKW37962.1 MAG: Segregation and condensation protein B [Candidatus Adlerbacteria bacterium GW2011_GWB1_54_7]